MRKVLPWLAAEKPDIFNAYQQQQSEDVEQKFLRARQIVSLIGHDIERERTATKARAFVGLYEIRNHRSITQQQYWEIPANQELKAFGMPGSKRPEIRWFDLQLTDFYQDWKGKLILRWPPPPVNWVRKASTNEFRVHAVLENSRLVPQLPDWREIVWSWMEMQSLPTLWQSEMRNWAAIYYVFDTRQQKGYVGSAYGEENLLGRWQTYAANHHGGNIQLHNSRPEDLKFSILERFDSPLT